MNDNKIREITPEESERFYDKLRSKVRGYTGKYMEWILLIPDLFMLLFRLSIDNRVPGKYRGLLLVGIAYFVSPIDVIPEALLGPLGLLDDLVISAYILEKIIAGVPREVVLEHWSGEEDILEAIRKITRRANDLVGNRLNKILKKIGLN